MSKIAKKTPFHSMGSFKGYEGDKCQPGGNQQESFCIEYFVLLNVLYKNTHHKIPNYNCQYLNDINTSTT